MNNEQRERDERKNYKGTNIVKIAFYFLTIVFFFFCIVNNAYICRKFLANPHEYGEE